MLHYISYIAANVSNIVDYLCKCIQLGWCVFHLNNRYLGLLIGKNKEVFQLISICRDSMGSVMVSKQIPSGRKKEICIFLILQFFPMVPDGPYLHLYTAIYLILALSLTFTRNA